MNSSQFLIQRIPNKRLDIIGDIHGEYESLCHLLQNLGYDNDGNHPENRHLVFVGDYCDRGPNSPAVIALVEKLVRSMRASAILGNHELNLLLDDAKDGAGWYFDSQYEDDQENFSPFNRSSLNQRKDIRDFLLTLPIALERDDIRIVHAAWDVTAISKVRENLEIPLLDLYDQWHQATQSEIKILLPDIEQEKRSWSHKLSSRHHVPPMLLNHAKKDVINQMNNPLKILTSGIERQAEQPFYSSGKWRFAKRIKWWDEYNETIPVVIGHYWRQPQKIDRSVIGKGDNDLFVDIEINAWHGKHRNVFCVDFSAGGKWAARKNSSLAANHFMLAALRWPEKTIVFNDGLRSQTKFN